MSRKIKFRAWDNKNKKFIDIISMDFNNNNNLIEIFDEKRRYELKEFILSQYTGLKDKNGIEIYEGDIIKVPISSDNSEEIIGTINYQEHECYYYINVKKENIILKHILIHEISYCAGIEIIGNIYKNTKQ